MLSLISNASSLPWKVPNLLWRVSNWRPKWRENGIFKWNFRHLLPHRPLFVPKVESTQSSTACNRGLWFVLPIHRKTETSSVLAISYRLSKQFLCFSRSLTQPCATSACCRIRHSLASRSISPANNCSCSSTLSHQTCKWSDHSFPRFRILFSSNSWMRCFTATTKASSHRLLHSCLLRIRSSTWMTYWTWSRSRWSEWSYYYAMSCIFSTPLADQNR